MFGLDPGVVGLDWDRLGSLFTRITITRFRTPTPSSHGTKFAFALFVREGEGERGSQSTCQCIAPWRVIRISIPDAFEDAPTSDAAADAESTHRKTHPELCKQDAENLTSAQYCRESPDGMARLGRRSRWRGSGSEWDSEVPSRRGWVDGESQIRRSELHSGGMAYRGRRELPSRAQMDETVRSRVYEDEHKPEWSWSIGVKQREWPADPEWVNEAWFEVLMYDSGHPRPPGWLEECRTNRKEWSALALTAETGQREWTELARERKGRTRTHASRKPSNAFQWLGTRAKEESKKKEPKKN
ncbi:hypothetical protein DFH09DRAFT_1088733 [Mycena vulgaris]|nr:hypothetical protein DFH09DRAFT_1088733 [Mycena vulgaris]